MLVKNLQNVGKRVQSDGSTKKGGDFDLYDVVIVGGGTAGCVLASRLTEDPNIRVLVLESGKSSLKNLLSRIPAGFVLLWGSKSVHNLYTTPQISTSDRKFYWPRGRMLGGSSAINAQIYHCGAPSDYDEWARLAGPGGEPWSYSGISKYINKYEKFNPSKAHPEVDASLRGSSGPVNVGFYGHHSEISEKFIKSCGEVGIPKVPDLNTAKGSLGVAKLMTYIDSKGHRVTTESAYLTPDVLARKNLTVAIDASVTRILFETSDGAEPRASGVEFTTGAGAPRFRVRAKKEVIMCAGAIHTPHIMLLSGLGPAAELKEYNVSVVADLPEVGKHLMDHPVVNVAYRETSGHSLIILRPRTPLEAVRAVPHVLKYFLFGKGGLTTNVCEAAAFFRSTDSKLFSGEGQGETPKDTTSGPEAPDLEMLVSPFGYSEHGIVESPRGNSMGLHMCLIRPRSLGSITLKSNDPFEAPIIDPKYLSDPNDISILLRGMHLLTRTSQTAPLTSIIDHKAKDSRFGNTLASASDDELKTYIKKNLQTLYHPTSSTRMAPKEDGGVVDVRLRVYGVKGLRVVDAGAFPTIVSGHTFDSSFFLRPFYFCGERPFLSHMTYGERRHPSSFSCRSTPHPPCSYDDRPFQFIPTPSRSPLPKLAHLLSYCTRSLCACVSHYSHLTSSNTLTLSRPLTPNHLPHATSGFCIHLVPNPNGWLASIGWTYRRRGFLVPCMEIRRRWRRKWMNGHPAVLCTSAHGVCRCQRAPVLRRSVARLMNFPSDLPSPSFFRSMMLYRPLSLSSRSFAFASVVSSNRCSAPNFLC